ncbi:MAG TPA: hypothetical protein VLV78_04100 [Thermoanaerobaculia bacterium]|nr:hypothetical protein [Thermoanaerobaculia bacterium]
MKKVLVAAAILLAATAAVAKTDALSLIPKDAVTVGVIHINQIRSSPLSSMLFEHTDRVSSNGEADRFLTEAGLDPTKDIDVVVVATSPRATLGREADVVVFADGRFNVDRLTKALVSRGATQKNDYFLLPESEKPAAVAFPDARLVIIGTESAVAEALATRASGGSGFASAGFLGGYLSRLDPNATAWALVDVARASRLTGAPHVPHRSDAPGAALAAAVRNISTVGVWATDTGDALKLGAFGLTNDEETLQLVEDTLRGALSAMRLAVKDSQPDMVSVLRRFDVQRSNDSVRISGSIPAEALRKMMTKHRAEK